MPVVASIHGFQMSFAAKAATEPRAQVSFTRNAVSESTNMVPS